MVGPPRPPPGDDDGDMVGPPRPPPESGDGEEDGDMVGPPRPPPGSDDGGGCCVNQHNEPGWALIVWVRHMCYRQLC